MIFLPNFFERYTAALRVSVEHLVLQNGIRRKYLEMLSKIHTAEALFSKTKSPVDLAEYSATLLMNIMIKRLENGEFFSYNLKLNGTYIINKKLYSTLILKLARKSEFLKIICFKGKILIRTQNTDKKLHKIIKALGGISLFEIKSKTLLIVLNPVKTDKKAETNEKDRDLLLDPFSSVNIYLV